MVWCRAALAAIAISYIVCVLILNGLQKEDLDVNTLRKLQRHNVNIDDMNNEALRKECETANKNSNENADKNTPIIINDKKEDQKIKMSYSNLQNIIINYFNNVQKTNMPSNNEKTKNDEAKPITDLPSVDNFKKVWNMLSTASKHEEVERTTEVNKMFTVITTIATTTNTRTDDQNMEYMNKITENFIANHKITTTNRPTTKRMDYDLLAQKIKEILANSNNTQQNPSPQSTAAIEEIGTDQVDEKIKVPRNDSIQFIDNIIRFNNPFKIFGPVRENNSNNIHFENKLVQYNTKRQFSINDENPGNIIATVPHESPQYKNTIINNQEKSISEDIIREISESVKKKVLQDLKKETTTNIPIATTKYTTTTPTTVTRSGIVNIKSKLNERTKDVTDVLEKFMEMFQQLKANIQINQPMVTKNKTAEENIETKNNAQVILHPPTFNFPIPKPIPVNITSVIINPFNPIHNAPVLPNQPYAVLNINPPVQIKPRDKQVQKITQLNIFNTKNNFHTSPITIQTNSYEVPPLGLPAQQSVVYQNIVVTTKHPFEKDFRNYPSYEIKYNDNKYKTPPYQRPPRNYHEFEVGRNERSRQFSNDEYSKEINRLKPIKHKYGRQHYRDRNTERFHEKLEKADNWPHIARSYENMNNNYEYRPPKLISRHQHPLNNANKRSRYDDTHFRNFLKTQQKVNDMLEKILASKTGVNGPRSVETTV